MIVHFVLTRLIGLHRHYCHVVIDPVLPSAWDGLESERKWDNLPLTLRSSISAR